MKNSIRPPEANSQDVDGASEAFDLSWIAKSTGRAERRQVVVLAVGFNPIDVSDPEELLEAFEQRRSFVAAIVERHGGSVGRVDPNALVVAWGWPESRDTDTRLAVAAALEISSTKKVAARCGLDAGIAVTADADASASGLGFVGEMVASATDYSLLARTGEVLVGDNIARLVNGAFEIEPVSASDNDCACWRVLKRLVSDVALAGSSCSGLDLQGRSRERGRLSELWRGASAGITRLVQIHGEAGVGKSAMLSWLQGLVVESGGRIIRWSCQPEAQPDQFAPVRQLADLMGKRPCAGTSEVVDSRDAGDFAHLGCCDEGAGLHKALLAALEAGAPHAKAVAAALWEMFAHHTKELAIAIVLEDIHWADGSTLQVLRQLARFEGSDAKLLLVVTSRINEKLCLDATTQGWRNLEIGRLEAGEIEALVRHSEYSRKLDRETRKLIVARADGLPFHALELARLCAEHADVNAHHRLLARPNLLNAGLTSRLDELLALKPLAQAAAVLGRLFDSRVLAETLHMPERLIVDRLEALVSDGVLVRRRSWSGGRYRFYDALLWSQAYGSVLKSRRKELHSRFAAVLEGEVGERIGAAPEAIAHHWAKGGRDEKAFGWWLKAGLEASERCYAANAVAFLNEALQIKERLPGVCSPHEEATLMSVLGGQMRVLRGSASQESVAAYQKAMDVVSRMTEAPGDLDLDIAWGLTTIHLVRGDITAASDTSSRLVSDAQERGREDILMAALRVHGTARLLGGNVQEAIELLKDAASRYRAARGSELHSSLVSDPGAVVQAHLASAFAIAGDEPASRDACRKALELAAQLAHPHTTANVLGVLALAAVNQAKPGEAAAFARAGHAIARRHHFKYWELRAELVLAWHAGLSAPDESLERVGEALSKYRKTGANRSAVFAACLAAQIAVRAGRSEAALAFLAPARDAGQRHGEWLYMPEMRRLTALAVAIADQERCDECLAMLDEAEAMSREHGSLVLAERIIASRHRLMAVSPLLSGNERSIAGANQILACRD